MSEQVIYEETWYDKEPGGEWKRQGTCKRMHVRKLYAIIHKDWKNPVGTFNPDKRINRLYAEFSGKAGHKKGWKRKWVIRAKNFVKPPSFETEIVLADEI